jgi:hypothetical protein
MIDSSRLTLAFQEEARSLAARMTFSDAPHIGPDEKFSKLLASHPLPETEQICYVLDEAFWASLLTEEGRPCRVGFNNITHFNLFAGWFSSFNTGLVNNGY